MTILIEHIAFSLSFFPLENFTLAEESLSLTYDSWTHTLRDLATYSPYAIDGCHLRLLFIIYQLLKIISFIHQRGLSSGPLQLTDIHINERYWIQLKPRFHSALATVEFTSDCSTPHTNAPTGHHGHDDESQLHSSSPPVSRSQSANMPTNSKTKTCISNHSDEAVVVTTITPATLTATRLSQSSVYHVEHRYETYCRTHIDIVELIKQWQLGHVSNFDYLLILNALAGRRFHDPNNHLIFPWINDFTSATQKLRDLSQTKYRLNKGSREFSMRFLDSSLLVNRFQATLNST